MQYRDKLYRRNKWNAQHKGRENPKTRRQNSGEKAGFAGVAARVEHAQTPGAPSSSSNAEDPRRRQARPEKAGCGLHRQSESKNTLAREDHSPSSGEARDQYFRQ
jgi:hypothetical protein